ncbi:MAG: hypothetical protein AAGJ79_06455 [Verrucomicrobiota bacterium]
MKQRAESAPKRSNTVLYLLAIGVVVVSGFFALEQLAATRSEALLGLVAGEAARVEDVLERIGEKAAVVSGDEGLAADFASWQWQPGSDNGKTLAAVRERVGELLGEPDSELLGFSRYDQEGGILFRAGRRFPLDLSPPPRISTDVGWSVKGPFRNGSEQFLLVEVPVIGGDGVRVGTDQLLASMDPLQEIVRVFREARKEEELILGTSREKVSEIFFDVRREGDVARVDLNVGLALASCSEGSSGLIWPDRGAGAGDTVAYRALESAPWGVVVRAPGSAYPKPGLFSVFTSLYFWAGLLVAAGLIGWSMRRAI